MIFENAQENKIYLRLYHYIRGQYYMINKFLNVITACYM